MTFIFGCSGGEGREGKEKRRGKEKKAEMDMEEKQSKGGGEGRGC